MLFHSRTNAALYDILLYINKCSLECTDTFTYLGVVLDSCLNGQYQLDAVCSKLASSSFAFLQAREYFDVTILRILCFSLVNCHL